MTNLDTSHFALVEVHLKDKHLEAELLDQTLCAHVVLRDTA